MKRLRTAVLFGLADLFARLGASSADHDAATTRPTPSTPAPPPPPPAGLEELKRDVMRELGAELERVAPWLYEPIGPKWAASICTFCGEDSVYDFGKRFNIGGYPQQRVRCTRCGTTSVRAGHELT